MRSWVWFVFLGQVVLSGWGFANSSWVDDRINKMSLEEKVGQLFIVGVRGKSLSPSTKKKLQQITPGGVILFGTNIKNPYQTAKFNYNLQQAMGEVGATPLFTSIDQEGGLVTRIKSYPRLPSALAVGKAGNLKLAHELAFQSSKILKDIGFNINFAPVLDISAKNHKDFIGTRAFSSDKDEVSNFAISYLKGYEKSGILGVAKHFPGHGEVKTDSHFALPTLNFTKKRLLLHSTIPYQRAYKSGALEAVMVGHLAVPSIDPRKIPATFSRLIIDDFLRQRLGYDGLVVTDDIEMSAAGISKDPGIRALKAFTAGADMIMVAWNEKSQIRAHQFLVNAVKNGVISKKRLEKSLRRILSLKNKYVKDQPYLQKVDKQKIADSLKNKLLGNLIYKVHSINLNRQRSKSRPSSSKLIFFSAEKPSGKLADLKYYRINRMFTAKKLEHLLYQQDGQTTVFHVSGRQTAKLLHRLPSKLKNKLIVINTSKPSLVSSRSKYRAVVNLYSNVSQLDRLLVDSIFATRNISSEAY